MIVLRTPVLSGVVRRGRLRARGRRRRARHHPLPVSGQRRRAPRAGAGRARSPGLPPETIPPAYFCRGVYFTLSGRSPFRRLVYPVPPAGGLGVHITLDLAGQARFGPDVEWISGDRLHGRPGARRRVLCRGPQLLAGAARRRVAAGLCRDPPEDQRPRANPPPILSCRDRPTHGVPGLVNLYGIESPGLTASLPLADEVVARLLVTGI